MRANASADDGQAVGGGRLGRVERPDVGERVPDLVHLLLDDTLDTPAGYTARIHAVYAAAGYTREYTRCTQL